jgi:hypothetical protein
LAAALIASREVNQFTHSAIQWLLVHGADRAGECGDALLAGHNAYRRCAARCGAAVLLLLYID